MTSMIRSILLVAVVAFVLHSDAAPPEQPQALIKKIEEAAMSQIAEERSGEQTAVAEASAAIKDMHSNGDHEVAEHIGSSTSIEVSSEAQQMSSRRTVKAPSRLGEALQGGHGKQQGAQQVIRCSETNGCKGQVLSCEDGKTCEVECSGEGSCPGGITIPDTI